MASHGQQAPGQERTAQRAAEPPCRGRRKAERRRASGRRTVTHVRRGDGGADGAYSVVGAHRATSGGAAVQRAEEGGRAARERPSNRHTRGAATAGPTERTAW